MNRFENGGCIFGIGSLLDLLARQAQDSINACFLEIRDVLSDCCPCDAQKRCYLMTAMNL